MGSVIKVNDVSMMFNLSSEKIDSIKEYFIKAVRRELHFQEFWALRQIHASSVHVEMAEVLVRH